MTHIKITIADEDGNVLSQYDTKEAIQELRELGIATLLTSDVVDELAEQVSEDIVHYGIKYLGEGPVAD